MTRHLIPRLWHIEQQTLAYYVVTAVICRWPYKHCANCQHSPFCFFRELPKVCGLFFMFLAVHTTLVRPLAYRGRIWRTSFNIDGCSTVRTVTLRWTIFKRKKGFTTISLGQSSIPWSYLNYHLVTLSL
jgi:hypothetical protein